MDALLEYLPMLYSKTEGVNWNLVLLVGSLFLLSKINVVDRLLHALFDWLGRQVNKIPFFASTDLDEKLFETIEKNAVTLVHSRMDEANMIKTKYMLKIKKATEAEDLALAHDLTEQMRKELEGLTDGAVKDFFDGGDKVLVEGLVARYGDRAKAGLWFAKKVKSIVEASKKPDAPSVTSLVMKTVAEGLEKLGNDS